MTKNNCACTEEHRVWIGNLCKKCYWRLRKDLRSLVFAHSWLRECMIKYPQWSGDKISGSRTPPAPLRVQMLDHARIIETLVRQIVIDLRLTPKPIDEVAGNVELLEKHDEALATHPAIMAMADSVRRVKETAHRISPWRHSYINLPIPCPGCDLLTLRLYSGDSYVSCRNKDCKEIAMPHYRYDRWVKSLILKHGLS